MTHEELDRLWFQALEDSIRDGEMVARYHFADLVVAATAPPQQALTIERLRDALVASRIIPPAAVEDPDEYDDGVTLFRIEALHRRIT